MAAPRAQPRLDERALAAGTTVRFALLVILLLVASGSMMVNVVLGLQDSDYRGCTLAAGADPDHGSDAANAARVLSQDVAFAACVARHAPPPPRWGIAVWPVLLAVVAGAVFFMLSAWKARRGRVVPLESVDRDGDLRRMLESLAATAGLARVPRVVVDPAAASTGAVVFGRTRRPTVCLHGGLLARRHTDPESFRAVLLHEFAHIRYGDVTLTYATVAVWRVFLAAVLLPYLVWELNMLRIDLPSENWPHYAPAVTRNLLLAVVTAALVYLARSDVLRSREVYADLAAVRWGADPHSWAVTSPASAGGSLRRAFTGFAELWGTHPRWDLRRDALADPATLFGVPALPMFLTGTAATLISSHLLAYLTPYSVISLWLGQAAALAAAGAVTGVVGIALWRAVVHAVLTGRRVPSGLRAGLRLGYGMAAAELVAGRVAGGGLVPSHPWPLLLVVLAGAGFAWWVTQCAKLWARTWQGRTLQPVMLLGLTGAFLVLSSWFAWWQGYGAPYAHGAQYSSAGVRAMLLRGFPGPGADHSAVLSTVVAVYPWLVGMPGTPLALAAVAALWVVPLLAWMVRPATTTARWAREAVRDLGDLPEPLGQALPPLRRVLLPGLLGGAACWVAVVGVRAYLHPWRPVLEQLWDFDRLVYAAWMLVALVAASAGAACAASALAIRYRLLTALIAAQTALLVGLTGVLALGSLEGCIQPLNTLQPSCQWHPAFIWPIIRLVGVPALVLGAIAALAIAAAIPRTRRVRLPWTRRVASARPSALSRHRPATRRLCVGVLCAVALGTAVTQVTVEARTAARVPNPATAQQIAQQYAGADRMLLVSSHTRAMQVHAWKRLSGRQLLDRRASEWDRLLNALREARDSKNATMTYLRRIRPICVDIGRLTRDAADYFQVPDPRAQSLWQGFINQVWKGSQGCEQALDQQNPKLLSTSISELGGAGANARAVAGRIHTVLTDDGYSDS